MITHGHTRSRANLPPDQVAEAAVVGINDELTGQAVNAFVSLKEGNETNEQVRKDLIQQVRKSIGPFAAPKAIFMIDDLPKTRSGKIMRRILRKILSGEEDQLGDISTVSFPSGSRFCESTLLTGFPARRSERRRSDHRGRASVPEEMRRAWISSGEMDVDGICAEPGSPEVPCWRRGPSLSRARCM